MGIIVVAAFAAVIYPVIGSASGRQVTSWYRSVELPEWAGTPRSLTVSWLSSMGLFGVGAALASDQRESILVISLVVPILAALWLYLLMGRNDVRNSFYFVSVVWTAAAILAALFYARRDVAGLLAIPLLATLTWFGAVNFFAWQMNAPTQRTPPKGGVR